MKIKRRMNGGWRSLTGAIRTTSSPLEPTNIGASSNVDETGHVTWSPPLDYGGSAITGYTVTARRVSNSSTFDSSAGSSATSLDVSGLIAGELYDFTVKATNAVGTSIASVASRTIIAGTPLTHGEQITASNTGARTSTFTDMGDYTTTAANELHVNKRFTSLDIKHPGCVFVDCKIDYSATLYAVRITTALDPSPRLEHCTINAGTGSASVSGVATAGVQLYRCKIFKGINSAFLNGPATVEECYFTGLYHPDGAHADCLQVTNNAGTYTRVLRCKFLAFDTDGTAEGYNTASQANASIQIGSLRGPCLNIDVTDCYFDGGNYTCSHNSTKNGVYGNPTGVWTGNKFGRGYRFGPENRIKDYFTFDSSNVYADTGLPV